MLHKSLKFKRYLIVIDDIWNTDAWNTLKRFFPNDHTRSRILLTSRHNEVALHAKPRGFIHQLDCLTEGKSWELLRKKVFHDDDCPTWLVKTGMQIASNCHGLPLAVVVIAGVLAKEVSKDYWERIAKSVGSYIVNDPNRYVETLALSFDHLPRHVKDCFLYLGGFSEDHNFSLRKVIWLWMAEGFIQEEENRSMEEIAEDYLIELVNKNLVVVVSRKFDGSIKTFSIHDLLRELCMEKATKESFFLKIDQPMIPHPLVVPPYKQRRIFTSRYSFLKNYFDLPALRIRSLTSRMYLNGESNESLHSFPLLIVLDIRKCDLKSFPQEIELLVHLRHLAISCREEFPSLICNLWSLQTLIVECNTPLFLPDTISNLVNLWHLWSDGGIVFPSIGKPINLQTISSVTLGVGADSWVKCFPMIKKLTFFSWSDDQYDFGSLSFLETLKLTLIFSMRDTQIFPKTESLVGKDKFTLPASLKKLTLDGCRLPWSDMSIVQSLPNLEVLKILRHVFVGPHWEASEKQFCQLKFLRLQGLNIQKWDARSDNFPCLKRLALAKCKNLKEIPLELGDISTLEIIEVDDSSRSVVESLERIQKEQQNVGNYDMKIIVRKLAPFDLFDPRIQSFDFVKRVLLNQFVGFRFRTRFLIFAMVSIVLIIDLVF